MKKTNFITHTTAAIVITILFGVLYAAVQQTYRTGANDPQLQVAHEIKNAILQKEPIEKWMSDSGTELAASDAVFKTIYSPAGEPLLSTGLLHGAVPRIPKGVLDYARDHQEHFITWQPQQNVRMAMVIDAVNTPEIGFVVTGRSLAETEKRTSSLVTLVFIGWLACICVIALHFILQYFINKKQINS